MSAKEIHCDICGELMLPLPGCGFDCDRIICTNADCFAEIVFPTTTDAFDNELSKGKKIEDMQTRRK
jgi:hypothetical protein